MAQDPIQTEMTPPVTADTAVPTSDMQPPASPVTQEPQPPMQPAVAPPVAEQPQQPDVGPVQKPMYQADPFLSFYADKKKQEVDAQSAAQSTSTQAQPEDPKSDEPARVTYKPEGSPEGFTGYDGRLGSKSDYAALSKQLADDESAYLKNLKEMYAPSLQREFGDGVENLNLRETMDAVGEDYDEWRQSFWRSRDLVPPEFTNEERGSVDLTEQAKTQKAAEEEEARKAKEDLYASVGVEKPEGFFGEITDYFGAFGGTGFETATRKRLLEQAQDRRHLDALVDAELARDVRMQEYATDIDDPSKIDSYSWQYGLGIAAATSAVETVQRMVEFLPELGAGAYALGGKTLGLDTEMFDNWIAARADQTATRHFQNSVFRGAYKQVAGDGFLASTAYTGVEIGTMLAIDAATSFVTGKLIPFGPGIRATGKALGAELAGTRAGVASARAAGEMAKDTKAFFNRAFFGKGPSGTAVAGAATRTGVPAIPGAKQLSGAAREIADAGKSFLNKPVSSFNTFLYRVGADSFTNSYARQLDRAAMQGREPDASDAFFAAQDAIAHMAIAHLIGRNIPGISRFPKTGSGSRGLMNSGPYSTATMNAALRRSMARTMVGGVKSGKDFVMFDILMDAYSLSDGEDRMATLDKWVNNGGDSLKHLFGSFLIGGAIGGFHMPANFSKEMRKIRDAKDGAEAWKTWSSLSEAEKKSYLDHRSEAFQTGMLEQLNRERQAVSQNELLFTGISNQKLAEILFYGDKELPDVALMAGGADGVGYRFTVEGGRISDPALRSSLADAQGNVGLTRGMALAEAQRRGMSLDVAQFGDGSINFLYEGRTAIGQRRTQFVDKFNQRRNQVINTPPSPKGIRSVNIEGRTKEQRSVVLVNFLRTIGLNKEKIRTKPRAFVEKVIRDARLSTNPEAARAVGNALKGVTTVDGVFAAARRSRAVKESLDRVVASERQFMPEARGNRAILNNIVRANPGLLQWIVGKVHRGQNTTQNPAISRRHMERLFPDLPARNNTKEARQRIGDALAHVFQDTATGPKVRTPDYKTGPTDVVRTSAEQPAPKFVPSRALGVERIGEYKSGQITSEVDIDGYGRPLDRATSTETARQARERGVSAEDLFRQQRGKAPVREKAETETVSPAQAEQGTTQRIRERLENATQETDPIVEVPNNETNLTTKQSIIAALNRIDFLFGTGAEVQFTGEPGSNLMSAIAPQANAAGLAVVIAHGMPRDSKRVDFFVDGVVIVRSDVSPRVARMAIARHYATARWLRETRFPIARAILGAFTTHKRIRQIVSQSYGSRFSVEEVRTALREMELGEIGPDATYSGVTSMEIADFFETVMPLLSDSQRAEIFRTDPKAFSEWFIRQQDAYREFGFENPRKGSDILGTERATRAMERIARGEPIKGDLRRDGKLAAQHIKALNTAFERRRLIEPNPELAVIERKLNRIGDKVEAVETPTPTDRKPESLEMTEGELAETREAIEPIELFNNKTGMNNAPINELEMAYPGLMSRIDAEVANTKSGVTTFEHMGKTVELLNTRGSIAVRIHEPGTVDRRGPHAESTMTASERETADKVHELIERGSESTMVDVRELLPDSVPPSPPKPPAEPKPGEPSPEPAGDTLNIEERSDSRSFMRRVFDGYLGGIGRFFHDPLNLSIMSGNAPFRAFVEKLYSIEQSIRDELAADQFGLNVAHRALAKDKESTLLTDREGRRLVEILETPIAEKDVDTHPMTASLRESERNYIKVIRRINEVQRQSIIADKRKAVEMRYKYASMKQNLAAIREAKPEWKVDFVKSGRKGLFEITTPEGTVRLTRETLPDFMAKNLVTDNFGYKDSYFPHLFFGKYKGEILVKNEAGEVVDTIRFGTGEARSREVERSEILVMAEAALERKRLESPDAAFTFDINIKEAGGAAPADAVYMPGSTRRNLVNAIKDASGAHRSEINAALNGRVESRAVRTAFLAALLKRKGAEGYSTNVHKVMEVAMNNFYRNKLSKQIQEQATPILREMEVRGNAPRWIPEYGRKLAEHTVFGSRGLEQMMRDAGLGQMADLGDRLFGGLRAFQFYRQLVRPGQHIINSTQALQVWSLLGTAEFSAAVKDYNSKAGQDFIKEWGFFDQAGYNPGKFGDSLSAGTGFMLTTIHTAGNKVIGKVWNPNSESRNQNFSFYALARHAMKNLNMSPKEAAQYGRIWGSLFTQYRFSRANDPVFLRGNVMKTLGQFKRFQVQTLGMAMSLSQNAKSPETLDGIGRSALGRFMLLNTVLGGVRGSLIGFGVLATGGLGVSVYSAIKQMFDDEYLPSLPDKPFANEAAAYKWLLETSNNKKFADVPVAEIAMFGVGRVAGLDLSGTFNLTNLGPGGLGDYFMGPTLGMFSRIYQDAFANRDALARPATERMFESLIDSGAATKSLKSLYEYIKFHDELGDMEQAEYEQTMLGLFGTGRRRSGTSELIMDRDKFDFYADIVGLRSADYTAQFMLSNIARVVQETWTDARNRIGATYNQDPEKAYRMMASWNDAYGALAPMTYSDIAEMSMNALERVTQTRDERNLNRLQDVSERVQAELTQLRE